ncbi:MAG: hypothetical protein FWG90_01955 [Oscillospiraceae bacterium]|nr:hypothetical protein [Oscillospiraceae bacterium]
MLDFFKTRKEQSSNKSFNQKKDSFKSKLKWLLILIIVGYFVFSIVGVAFNARNISDNKENANTSFISKIFNNSEAETADTVQNNNEEKTGFAGIRISPINIFLYVVVLFIMWRALQTLSVIFTA